MSWQLCCRQPSGSGLAAADNACTCVHQFVAAAAPLLHSRLWGLTAPRSPSCWRSYCGARCCRRGFPFCCWFGFRCRFSPVASRRMHRGGLLHTCPSAVAMRHSSCLPGFAGNARVPRRPSWWLQFVLCPHLCLTPSPFWSLPSHLQCRSAGSCAAGGGVRRAAPLRQDCGRAPQLQVGAAAALGACCAAGSLRLAVAASRLCRQRAFASVLWWPQRPANASFSECCILQRVLHLALGAPDWYLVPLPPRSAIHGAVARCLKLSLSKPVGQVRPCIAQHIFTCCTGTPLHAA